MNDEVLYLDWTPHSFIFPQKDDMFVLLNNLKDVPYTPNQTKTLLARHYM